MVGEVKNKMSKGKSEDEQRVTTGEPEIPSRQTTVWGVFICVSSVAKSFFSIFSHR
jgi:hypothetical protein